MRLLNIVINDNIHRNTSCSAVASCLSNFSRRRKTVGFSKWDYPHALTAEQREREKQKAVENRLKKVVEGSNEGLMKDFFNQLTRGRDKWLVPGETFCE